jgi:hypothetical protein
MWLRDRRQKAVIHPPASAETLRLPMRQQDGLIAFPL